VESAASGAVTPAAVESPTAADRPTAAALSTHDSVAAGDGGHVDHAVIAAAEEPPAERTDPWAQLIADPGHAPELLGLAAVQFFGPRAKDWANRTRDAYPAASEQAIARLAVRQFSRFGGLSSVFGAVAGSYAPVALVGASAITHAELVLHLAAAYGKDPTGPERVAELLVITRVHPTLPDAEAALDAARRPAYEDGGLSSAVWRLGRMVAAQTGAWTVLRLVNRFFPGTALLAAALTGNSSAQMVAARAMAYYSQRNQESGSSV
jgi:hypothetical protein